MFNLVSKYTPSGDQPEAIKKLVDGINNGNKHQVLLGATGTGKTFTIANVIKSVNKPTLVLAHNKTYNKLTFVFTKRKPFKFKLWIILLVCYLNYLSGSCC